MTPKEILLALAAPAIAGAVGLLATLSGTDNRPAEIVKANVLSSTQTSSDESRSTSGNENSDKDLLSSTTFMRSFNSSATSSDLTYKIYPSREAALEELASKQHSQSPTEQAEVYEPQVPLVFLNHANILPATEEAAAATAQMQKDFIDSTGAATADPADPNFADRWDQFQPTVDEQFCAMFGTEACNALSIERRRQIGHF